MNTASFIYYGYDKETYKECKSQIRWTNLHHMFFLNSWILIVILVFLGIRIYDQTMASSVFVRFNMNGLDRLHVSTFVIFAVIAVILEIITIVFMKHQEWPSHYFIYCSTALMLGFALMISLAQSMKPTIFFHVVLVLVAVSYIDTMLNMGIVLTGISVFFLMSIYKGLPLFRIMPKPQSISNEDVFYTFLTLTLALVLHFSTQRTRLRQFVTYLKNIQITHELEVKSSFDTLTSLLNRGRFMSMATEVLRTRQSGEYIVICLLDLDHFKQINDKLGHQMGDKAIQIAGQTIIDTLGIDQAERWSFPERAIRDRLSFAGRLGGDEFIVLMRGKPDEEAVQKHMSAMLSSLNGVELGELRGLEASIGITAIADNERDIAKAYSGADDALYRSKRAGRNRITFHAPEDEIMDEKDREIEPRGEDEENEVKESKE